MPQEEPVVDEIDSFLDDPKNERAVKIAERITERTLARKAKEHAEKTGDDNFLKMLGFE